MLSRMPKRLGSTLIYIAVVLVAMVLFCSLATDYGRVQLAKTEMRRATDSAARAGAAGICTDASTAIAIAKQYAVANNVDGQPLVLNGNTDIEFGKWNRQTMAFTTSSASTYPTINAIHITARRTKATDNPIPLVWAPIVGVNSCNLTVESVAMVVPEVNVDQYISATANPFLAGAAAGTKVSGINPHNSPDYAGTTADPKQSPQTVNLNFEQGDALTFDSIDGTAGHDPKLPDYEPDGELTDIGHNNLTTSQNGAYSASFYNENGIADVRAPINALVGVFLGDEDPRLTAAPANLDFSTADSRDFETLQPQLKQIFFIGDGLNSKGVQQKFVVPQGATRFYLATWDFYEWNNNYGYRNVKVNRPMQIYTVK
jgi:Flp pilus assembly protein TadG